MLFITALELQQWKESDTSFHVLDVRENFEFELGNIGGIHIPMSEVPEKWFPDRSNGKTVLVCRSGKRAEAVANMLEKDYQAKEMYVLKGGLMSWKEVVDNQLELD